MGTGGAWTHHFLVAMGPSYGSHLYSFGVVVLIAVPGGSPQASVPARSRLGGFVRLVQGALAGPMPTHGVAPGRSLRSLEPVILAADRRRLGTAPGEPPTRTIR